MTLEKKNASSLGVSTCLSSLLVGTAFIAALAAVSAPAMAQDECASAVPLTAGTPAQFTFSPAFPTASANPPTDAQCGDGTFLWTASTRDLWYSFIAPSNGFVTFDTCEADIITHPDLSMALYVGGCGSMVQVACDGDYFGLNSVNAGCNSTTARIANFAVTAGTTYFVRVGSINNPEILQTTLTGHITASMSRVAGFGVDNTLQLEVPSGLGVPTKLSSGASHSLALNSAGAVFAWGSNLNGRSTVPAGLGTVLDVAAGGSHSLALKSNGSVDGWGLDTTTRATGGRALTNAVGIAAGNQHSLAVLSTGAVFGFGSNTSGQITIPAGLTGVVQVAAGNSHSIARRSNGAVAAWGLNTSGQTTVPAGLVALDIAAGAQGNFTVALRDDGTVAAWGINTNGQITVPADLTGVIDVAAGNTHTLALKSDGTIVAWGSNGLFRGDTVIPNGIGPVAAIAAGNNFSLAMYDECPGDPLKSHPGGCGCGIPDVDTDGDGTLDCDDLCPSVPELTAPVTYFADADADTFGAALDTISVCAIVPPTGYVTDSSDCNDGALLYADADGDTYGAGLPVACGSLVNTDCNDSVTAINPRRDGTLRRR